MNGIQDLLRALHGGEQHLARQLVTVADRHRTEHEVHHVAIDLAAWSREHTQRIADAALTYDLDLDPPDEPHTGLLSTISRKAAEAVGRHPEPALLLLRDLRELHLAASGNSLYWEMLAQAGQATRDERLLGLATRCHPRTLRQMRWTNTMIKNLSPQALASLRRPLLRRRRQRGREWRFSDGSARPPAPSRPVSVMSPRCSRAPMVCRARQETRPGRRVRTAWTPRSHGCT